MTNSTFLDIKNKNFLLKVNLLFGYLHFIMFLVVEKNNEKNGNIK